MNRTQGTTIFIEQADKEIAESAADQEMTALLESKKCAELAHHAMCLALQADVSGGAHTYGSPDRAAAEAAVDATQKALHANVTAIRRLESKRADAALHGLPRR